MAGLIVKERWGAMALSATYKIIAGMKRAF
jgi:hypothetical protein